MGVYDGADGVQYLPYSTSPAQGITVNLNTNTFAETNTNAIGLKILTRVAASGAGATNLYAYNGSGAPTTTSDTVPSASWSSNAAAKIYICARNRFDITSVDSNDTGDKIAIAAIGGGFTSTMATSLAGYIKTYLTAIGITVPY
jgi:hypothetical protein